MTTTHSNVTPPADDELVTQILARRRRRTPIVTLALVVAVAAGGAFVGGAEAQKHLGSGSSGSSASSARNALAARFGSGSSRSSGARGQSGGSGGFGFGGATAGTVTLIKDKDLYVTDSSGNTVIVHAAGATVTKTVTGSLQTIRPGDAVTVIGSQSSNGSTTARTIVVGTAGGGPNG